MRKIIITLISSAIMLAIAFGSFAFQDAMKVSAVGDQPYAPDGGGGGISVPVTPTVETPPEGYSNGNGGVVNINSGGGDNVVPGGGTGVAVPGGGTGVAVPGNGYDPVGPAKPATGASFKLTNPLKYGNICDLLTAIIKIITRIGAIVAVIIIIWIGFKFIYAQGNASQLSEAKKSFFYTVIGIAILLGASAIAKIIVNTVFTITSNGTTENLCNI